MASFTTTCTACTATDVTVFLEITQVPVHCNVLWPTNKEAMNAPRGDIRLGFCRLCGHVMNLAFDPSLMEYTQAYENSLHFSPSFQRFAEELVKGLITRHNLRNKDIVDIGCGKGDFLKLICSRGQNRGWGFDPSYVPPAGEDTAGVTFIQEFYSEQHAAYKADLIACRHVLEHIQFPLPFMQRVRRSVGDRFATGIYFEVPNVLYTLRDLGIWDIIHEHCSYFSAPSLTHVFSTAGFDVSSVGEMFGGQYLGIEAHASRSPRGKALDTSVAAIGSLVGAFANNYDEKTSFWYEQFSTMKKEGKKVVVWGGGSKGVTFLNKFNNVSGVEYMIDINPRKQGMFVPGTGQTIVGPESLKFINPDVVIVMNPLYKKEIEQQLQGLGLKSTILAG